MSCPAGRAAICPLGHVCHHVMAQTQPTDQQDLQKEGSQMAIWDTEIPVDTEYTAPSSGLGSLWEGQHPEILRYQEPASSLCSFTESSDPTGARAVPWTQLWKIAVSQVILESTTHSACTSCLLGLTCPPRTVRCCTNEAGLGHKEDKRP